MTTHSNNKDIKKRFEELFRFKSKEEQIEHEAWMLHYRIMQLVEKAMDEKGWNKKQLAQKIGKSQSYVTQLFMGNKIINLPMMSLFQYELGLEFKIETEFLNETCYTLKCKQSKPSENKAIKYDSDSSWLVQSIYNENNYELAG